MDFLFGIEHLGSLQNALTVACDTETTGLKAVQGGLRLVQFAALDRLPVVIDCWELNDDGWQRLHVFFNQERHWLFHNAVFDLSWLQAHQLYPVGRIYCTMLASRILTNGQPNVKHGLAPVVKRYLKRELPKELQVSDWSASSLSHEQLEYAARDVQVLIELDGPINQRMGEANLHMAWELECRALPAMAQLHRTGLPFDRSKLEALQADLASERDRLGAEFVEALDAALPDDCKLPRDPDGSINTRAKATGDARKGTKLQAGFNVNSPAQLLKVFTTLLGKAPVDANGKPSASRQALREYVGDHPVIKLYLDWKRVEKRRQMAESLLKHLEPDGFIRASYMQLGADTGRMSCNNPNNQQIPRDVRFRECVTAPEGWVFVVADYAQMELRLAAAVAEDKTMTEAFQAGVDLHTVTARALYGDAFEQGDKDEKKFMRQVAKSAAFGLLYGSGAKGLRNYAASMGIAMSLDEAGAIRSKFLSMYTGIADWHKKLDAEADKTNGDRWANVIIPKSGLRRYLLGENNKLTTRANSPIQGAGAAVLKHTLGKLWPLIYADGEDIVKLAGVIHDEVILLVKCEHAETWKVQLEAVMQTAESLWLGDIPPLAEGGTGTTWAEAK